MKKRIINESSRFLQKELRSVLGKDLLKLQEDITEGFDSLTMYAYDPESKANPEAYRGVFIERLSNFTYFEGTENGFTLSFPGIDSFDFTGIEFLINILVGTMGEYYEISAAMAETIGETDILTRTPISTYTEEPYFLIEKSEEINRKVKALTGKDLVRFPFSNVPSLEAIVFDPVEKFRNDNAKRIDKIVKDSVKRITQKFRGKPA